MNFKAIQKYILFGLVLLILDQASKYFMIGFLQTKLFQSFQVLPFFNFTLVINRGVSFGFLNQIPYPEYIISFIVICITFALIFLFLKEQIIIKKIALMMLISGAIGNTIDRFFYGGVIDFLDFHIGHLHYPAFNIADSIIFIGVFILLFPTFAIKLFRLKHL